MTVTLVYVSIRRECQFSQLQPYTHGAQSFTLFYTLPRELTKIGALKLLRSAKERCTRQGDNNRGIDTKFQMRYCIWHRHCVVLTWIIDIMLQTENKNDKGSIYFIVKIKNFYIILSCTHLCRNPLLISYLLESSYIIH